MSIFSETYKKLAAEYQLPLTASWAEAHWQLLAEANRAFNLTAIKDEAEAAEKHYLDSLLLLPELDALADGSSICDLGSGGGFPAIPLAAAKGGLAFTLIEATGKKCAFLEDCCEKLGIQNARVLSLRAEDAGREAQLREQFDAVTARALAALPVLLEYAAPMLKVGGTLFAMKGAGFQDEIDAAKHAMEVLSMELTGVREYTLPSGDGRAIVTLTKTAPTAEKYPRRSGMPSKRPL